MTVLQETPETMSYSFLPRLVVVAALSACTVDDAPPSSAKTYDRSYFGSWTDDDGDCLNTRHEILSELSTAPTQVAQDGCRVLRGRWYDPYSGEVTADATSLDIDHVVPLAWAWDHGAAAWSRPERVRFANDPRNLVPVSAGVNRSKGADGPDEWLPPFEEGRCQYVLLFLRLVRTYDLTVDAPERARLGRTRESVCA